MPDPNSVPPSPHLLANSSRRAASQQMPPSPMPASPSLDILPSNQNAINPSSSSPLLSPRFAPASSFATSPMGDNTGVGPGPGPLRHPRPLTAADLHLQLEKEQEAVVNRLTRELSILRAAHNASVVSNASSTSASASGAEPGSWTDTFHSGLGSSHYQPVRHHRTLSSTSSRSVTGNIGSVSTSSLAGISSPAPVRSATQPPLATGGIPLSRQSSSASRRSRAASPAPGSLPSSGSYIHHASDPSSYFASRAPLRSQSGSASVAATPASAVTTNTTVSTATTTNTTTTSELSPSILPATSRFEETVLRRAELEEIKRENEALRRRVRELERMVKDALALRDGPGSGQGQGQGQGQGREQGAPSEPQASEGQGRRSRAVSGTSIAASVIGVGVPDEEVKVGESAASAAALRRAGGMGSK